jgi:hypothetical protein
MQWLGKNWKRLHRFVYGSGIAVVTHALLATTMSKKLFVRDPNAISELKIYVAILSVLLVVRLPVVRTLLKQIPILLKRTSRSRVQANPGDLPDRGGEVLPKIHGRESSVSVKPTLVIFKPTSNSLQSNSKNELRESIGDSPADDIQLEEAQVQ